MNAHWADANGNPGWFGATTPSCIAMASASKGFTELGIETFNGHNWYNDFADRIVDTVREWALAWLQPLG